MMPGRPVPAGEARAGGSLSSAPQVGAAASVFMGWILSKAMLETRGLFWAWFIHFLSDVAIFSSLAIALA